MTFVNKATSRRLKQDQGVTPRGGDDLGEHDVFRKRKDAPVMVSLFCSGLESFDYDIRLRCECLSSIALTFGPNKAHCVGRAWSDPGTPPGFDL